MIDIESVQATTTSVMRIILTGAPEMKANYVDRNILPYHVTVKYAYRQHLTEDGWTEHMWHAVSVEVVGHRVLAPAKDGTQRLGKDTHEAVWSSYGVKDVQQDQDHKPLPEWLDKLISELRPSGSVDLPAATQ